MTIVAHNDALAAKISMMLAAFCKYWRCAQNLINECPHDSANIQKEVIGIEAKNIKEHNWIFVSNVIYLTKAQLTLVITGNEWNSENCYSEADNHTKVIKILNKTTQR